MKYAPHGVDLIIWVLFWILLLSVYNWDDDLARWLGRFAADVVTGFNGS